VSKEVFQKISYKDKPDGLFVLAKRPQLKIEQLKLDKNPLILVLETVEKPGNLGAILRTADAVGVDAVLLCEASTDIYNPNSIRASLGAIFTVSTLTCSNDEALSWLLKNKINIYSAELESSMDYKKPDYKKATAIVIGAEHSGLSNFWLQNAKQNIKISMKGQIDSLNASVSAAVLLYEVKRQRE
jgi:TrmH family RNA methyltransferase